MRQNERGAGDEVPCRGCGARSPTLSRMGAPLVGVPIRLICGVSLHTSAEFLPPTPSIPAAASGKAACGGMAGDGRRGKPPNGWKQCHEMLFFGGSAPYPVGGVPPNPISLDFSPAPRYTPPPYGEPDDQYRSLGARHGSHALPSFRARELSLTSEAFRIKLMSWMPA